MGDEGAARNLARSMFERHEASAAEVRQRSGGERFWLDVADELDAFQAEAEEARARTLAMIYTRRGVPVADVRRWGAEDPSFGLIAGEMDVLTARAGFRLLPGGASSHPLAVRMAAVTRALGPRPALEVISPGQKRQGRGLGRPAGFRIALTRKQYCFSRLLATVCRSVQEHY